MIVTCPGCASKYRVRNEAVPAEGARMRCPKCETLFLAKPPAGGATDDGGGEFSAMPQTGSFPPGAPSGNAGAPSLAPQGLPPSNTRPTAVPGFGAATAPAPFGPPSNTRPPGMAAGTGTPFPSSSSAPPFGASSAPPFGSSSAPPFGASSAPPFGASQAPPFGAPASAPFGAPASPPFGAAAPFGAPAPAPFGAPPQGAPFSPFGAPQAGSPFAGLPPPSVPTAPKTAGPVTAMMERFDPTAPPPVPAPSAGDDPFANLDLSAPAPSLGSSTLPSSSSSSMASSEIERPRPATQIPRASSLPAPALAQPTRAQQDSFAGAIGSYVALAAAVVAVVAGMTFAGWTSESLDLDDTLMASFENSLGVRPPRSFTGKDDLPLDELRRAATAKETAGDLASAAVLWRRVRARDASDQTARTAEPRVLTALGERLR